MVRERFVTPVVQKWAFVLGNFGRMRGLLSCEVCVFRVLRHKVNSCSCAQTLPLCKNASPIVVTESEISYLFLLKVFSKSVVFERQERSNCVASSIRLSVRFD